MVDCEKNIVDEVSEDMTKIVLEVTPNSSECGNDECGNRELIDMIRSDIFDEKEKMDLYVKELKEQIKFLKGEILFKNNMMFSLVSKISDKPVVETMPSLLNLDKKLCSNKTTSNIPIGNIDDIITVNEDNSQKVSSQKNNNELKAKKRVNDCDKRENKDNMDKHTKDKEISVNGSNKVEIIGDSLLNGLIDDKLSRNNSIKTRKYSGCTTNDLKHHVMPTIEKKPKIIICHVGTNDITNNVDTISNYQVIINRIKKKTPYTKIAISSVITRKDHKHIEKKVLDINNKLEEFLFQTKQL